MREKATGDLLVFIFVKIPLQLSLFFVKVKVFYHFHCRFLITCVVLEKDPRGSKVLDRYVQYQLQK